MAAPRTVFTYPLTGGRDFPVSFEYLARKFVQVSLKGAAGIKRLTLNTDYRFSAKNQITTTVTYSPDSDYDTIEVRRYTSATERLVDFNDGSILRAYDLNISQIQTLHVAEEARDLTADTIGVNQDGDLDARNRRIVNLADGKGDLDAVNYRQLFGVQGSAGQSASEAAASAAAAKQSEINAEESKRLAANSEITAVTSANTAVAASVEALASKQVAVESAAGALDSQKKANSSALEAKLYRDQAGDYAEETIREANRAKSEADRAWEAAEVAGEPQYSVPTPSPIIHVVDPNNRIMDIGRSNGVRNMWSGGDSFAMPSDQCLSVSGTQLIFYPQDNSSDLTSMSLAVRLDPNRTSAVHLTIQFESKPSLEFGVHANGRSFVRRGGTDAISDDKTILADNGLVVFVITAGWVKMSVNGGEVLNSVPNPFGSLFDGRLPRTAWLHDLSANGTVMRDLRIWDTALTNNQMRGIK